MAQAAKPDYIIRMITKDKQLVQSRKGDKDFWISPRGVVDVEFAKFSLRRDCIEKGVKLISFSVDSVGVSALVEWL